jgi:hypothetical protein
MIVVIPATVCLDDFGVTDGKVVDSGLSPAVTWTGKAGPLPCSLRFTSELA